MRVLTISFLKNCKHMTLCYGLTRRITGWRVKPEIVLPKTTGDPNLIEIDPTWTKVMEPELRKAVQQDIQVFPDFITEREEASMLAELEPQLKRMRYEFDHWDNAIHGFRETERTSWSDVGESVLTRVRATAFSPGSDAGEPLPHAHVLDLAPAGHIKPHIDAVRFCGKVIAGLCLVSSAVMHLEHYVNKKLALHAMLPRRALYIMRGTARYSFTHAVLGGDSSIFRGQHVPRLRRVAVICRSRPLPQHASDHTDPKDSSGTMYTIT